jgi:lipopolysaccharide biosynthesis regulator YciM
VKIAAAAVKTDRYRKPVVFAAEAQAWVRVAEAAAGESRKKAAEKALEVCAKALELDAEHTRALGTMGRAHAVLGHYNESVASHRKAVETANRYLGEPNAALVHYDFAVTLQGIARALAGKAPDKAAQFLAEAVFQCEAYLAKEPNGPRAGECLQIVADAGPGPGTGQDATGEKPEKTAQAGG